MASLCLVHDAIEMRTTITLEPDVEALLQKAIVERNLTFKQAVNFAIREGLTAHESERKPFVQPLFDMGECLTPDQALAVIGNWLDQPNCVLRSPKLTFHLLK
jgi:hypothetical protein